VGAIFLFLYGKFYYFVYPEWYLYGAISMFTALAAGISIYALSNVGSLMAVPMCIFSDGSEL
jgi:hypothetical protein